MVERQKEGASRNGAGKPWNRSAGFYELI